MPALFPFVTRVIPSLLVLLAGSVLFAQEAEANADKTEQAKAHLRQAMVLVLKLEILHKRIQKLEDEAAGTDVAKPETEAGEQTPEEKLAAYQTLFNELRDQIQSLLDQAESEAPDLLQVATAQAHFYKYVEREEDAVAKRERAYQLFRASMANGKPDPRDLVLIIMVSRPSHEEAAFELLDEIEAQFPNDEKLTNTVKFWRKVMKGESSAPGR